MLAFAVPPNSEKNLVGTYSDRLMRNFASAAISAATSPRQKNR